MTIFFAPEDVLEFLLNRFPVLREPSQQSETDWRTRGSGAPGSYVWVDVLFRWVIDPLLTSEREDGPALTAFFAAIEELTSSDNEAVQEFVGTGILESIGDSDEALRRSRNTWGLGPPANSPMRSNAAGDALIRTEQLWS